MLPHSPGYGHRGPDPNDPLEQIWREHLHQREICAALDKLAVQSPPDAALAAGLLPYFEGMLAEHFALEEEGLFALLRHRSEPGDDIYETLDRLTRQHQVALSQVGGVREIVAALAAGGAAPDPDQAAALSAFAAHERRHLIVENAIVLPLARARLMPDDLARLGRLVEHGGK